MFPRYLGTALFILSISGFKTAFGLLKDYNPCVDKEPKISAVAWIPHKPGEFMVFYRSWYFNYSLNTNSKTGNISRIRDFNRHLPSNIKDISWSDSSYTGYVPVIGANLTWNELRVYYPGQIYSLLTQRYEKNGGIWNINEYKRLNHKIALSVDCLSDHLTLVDHNLTRGQERRVKIMYQWTNRKFQEMDYITVGEHGHRAQITDQRFLKTVMRDIKSNRFHSCTALDVLESGDYIMVVDEMIYIRYKNRFIAWDEYLIFPCKVKKFRKTMMGVLGAFVVAQLILILIFCYPFYHQAQQLEASRAYRLGSLYVLHCILKESPLQIST